MLRNALLVMVTIAAILPTLSLTACQPSETAINAQNLKLPEQEIKIVGQLQYDNNLSLIHI